MSGKGLFGPLLEGYASSGGPSICDGESDLQKVLFDQPKQQNIKLNNPIPLHRGFQASPLTKFHTPHIPPLATSFSPLTKFHTPHIPPLATSFLHTVPAARSTTVSFLTTSPSTPLQPNHNADSFNTMPDSYPTNSLSHPLHPKLNASTKLNPSTKLLNASMKLNPSMKLNAGTKLVHPKTSFDQFQDRLQEARNKGRADFIVSGKVSQDSGLKLNNNIEILIFNFD
jgi:hypothetical protein